MQFYLISMHAPKWSRPKQGQLVSRLFYSNTVSWPLTISVKGKGHFVVVVFFSVIISAYSTSLIIQALSAMCDFLEISKPPKLFIIIIIIIKAIKSNYLTHILPIFSLFAANEHGFIHNLSPIKKSVKSKHQWYEFQLQTSPTKVKRLVGSNLHVHHSLRHFKETKSPVQHKKKLRMHFKPTISHS